VPLASPDSYGETMNRLSRVAILAAPPLFALLFVGFWLLAEIGRFATDEPRWYLATWLPFALIGASIALGRLLPIASLTLVGSLLVGQLLGVIAPMQSTSWPAYLGLLVTAVLVAWDGRRRYVLGLIAVFGVFSMLLAAQVTLEILRSMAEVDALSGSPSAHPRAWVLALALTVLFFALAMTCWFVGFAQRVVRERTAATAERTAIESELASSELEVTLASERDRIAQDVHDIMAHSLAVIVAQADGARYLSQTRPEATSTALDAISSSARASLVEVRMLMDALSSEPEGHSQPGLDDLAELVQRMESAGLAVTVDVHGEAAPLSRAQGLAVYRIVQESLTNTLRHAGPDATARVALDWRGPGLALAITSRANPAVSAAAAGAPAELCEGRGIRGMRERARLSGGWLSVGPEVAEDGRDEFLVTAFLPTPSEASARGQDT
jgi:signal transduction histidine kinase